MKDICCLCNVIKLLQWFLVDGFIFYLIICFDILSLKIEILSTPNRIKLDWIGSHLKRKHNQVGNINIKPKQAVWMNFLLKTEPNRNVNTLRKNQLSQIYYQISAELNGERIFNSNFTICSIFEKE